ncbi:uncharacterized protein DUF1311 [Mucilaginibacter gracilis]|uniref:Uncharacterized protein DUF1311 n=1 Tax=Mucilaginibacter gracilis TaxID=423350 RepID=A0A495IWY5_9SPHI|nr:lysozyme inhibitor LprI family protein [Mucilaginibacter gracilis]RKR81195.1 uncharacterized protein DUF1311 [Mucilaginibacter gracilis]
MKYLMMILGLLFINSVVKAQTEQTITDLEVENKKCLDKGQAMLGCEQKFYGQLDSVLNVAYKNLRAGLNPTEKLALKADQLKWLALRDKAFADRKGAFASSAQDDRMIAYAEMNSIVKARVRLLIKRISINVAKALPNRAQCVEKESKPNENGDVTITRTCTYQNYRSVSIGEPDYKGRTFWSSKVYLKQNGVFVKVTNAAFFNQNGDKLLAMLNKTFNEDFMKARAEETDPDSKACYGDKTKLDWFKP